MEALQENDPRQKSPVPWFDLICVGVAMLALAAVGYLCLTAAEKDVQSGQENGRTGGRNFGGGGGGHDRRGVPIPASGSRRNGQDGQLRPVAIAEPAHTAAAGADASSESPAAAQEKKAPSPGPSKESE
jgi:hypothetical protein